MSQLKLHWLVENPKSKLSSALNYQKNQKQLYFAFVKIDWYFMFMYACLKTWLVATVKKCQNQIFVYYIWVVFFCRHNKKKRVNDSVVFLLGIFLDFILNIFYVFWNVIALCYCRYFFIVWFVLFKL